MKQTGLSPREPNLYNSYMKLEKYRSYTIAYISTAFQKLITEFITYLLHSLIYIPRVNKIKI